MPRPPRSLALAPWLAAAACAAAAVPEPAWRPLFDGVSLRGLAPIRFGGEGDVVVRDGTLVLEFGSPLTGVTVDAPLPDAPYELEVVAARLDGTDFFCGLTFPIPGRGADGEPACLTLVLGGWGGTVCGLSSLDGDDAANNATRTLRAFAAGRFYRVALQVDRDRVAVTIDGEPLLTADLTGRELSLRPEVELSRPLGYTCFLTRAAVQSLRWRPR